MTITKEVLEAQRAGLVEEIRQLQSMVLRAEGALRFCVDLIQQAATEPDAPQVEDPPKLEE